MFRFDKREHEGIQVLALHGQLDAQSATALKSEVLALADAHVLKIVVDLADLNLVDSTGVGVLISLFKRTRSALGHVYFAGVQGQPREIFRLLRLDRALDLVPSVDAAIEALRRP